MVTKLEKSLEDRQDLFFTSLVKYDGVIKEGMVETNIVISTEKGTSPFFKKANVCVFLTDVKNPIDSEEISDFKDSEVLQKEIQKKVVEFFKS